MDEKKNTTDTYKWGVVDEKLNGILDHLERLNGKTDKSINNIDNNRKSIERLKTWRSGISMVGGFLFVILTIFIVPLFFQYTSVNWFTNDEDQVTISKKQADAMVEALQNANKKSKEVLEYSNKQ